MRAWHFSKDVLISREIVLAEGRSMLGRPAVKRLRRVLSLMILIGRLLSVTHLTRCALFDVGKQVSKHQETNDKDASAYRTSGFV
jgi:hypothetical protein